MNFKPTLLNELTDEKNHFLDDADSFVLTRIYTNLLFFLAISLIVISLLLVILNEFFFIFLEFSFNDYASLCLGNLCFYYCFRLVKNNIIPYYSSNPIFIIGIIYPAFFNSQLLHSLFTHFINNNYNITLPILILSVIVYYFILNKYYQNVFKPKQP